MDNEKIRPQEPPRDIRFEKPTFIDPLTDLFNRYYLYEFLPQEIKKSKFSNYPLGIFLLDIDNFKEINDKYGHLTGDDVLKQFSEILKKSRRTTDMVIRYAGDEFIILLPGVDRQTGLSLGRQLITQVAQARFKGKDGQGIRLTISVGLSLCPNDATEMNVLIDLADKALYLSKDKGKNQISYSAEATLERVATEVAMGFFPCQTFIDRLSELTQLKEMLHNIVLGKGLSAAAFVYGEAGSGKTRLVGEFNNYAQDKLSIIGAKGIARHKEQPYYIFASAIDSHLNKLGLQSPEAQELLSVLSAEELAELGRLIPGVETGGSCVGGKQGRSLLFKAILDFLLAINNKTPLILAFDDLQWADIASVELLLYLIKQEKQRNIFILTTFRGKPDFKDGDTDAAAQFFNYLHSSTENYLEISLSDLSQRDTYKMIEAMFPGLEQLKELNGAVYEITKGNPAFIEEIFKSMAENKFLIYKDNAWGLAAGLAAIDIPSSLEETMKRRVKNLDNETKELILQAAVIGEDFSVDLLKKIGENNEGYIFEVMSRAKKRHLIQESEKIGNFNFVNSSMQNTLYNELDDAERKNLHQKIGQAIAHGHNKDLYNVAADLSLHFGRAADDVIAAQYGSIMRQRAAELFNPAEAFDYLKEFAGSAVRELQQKEAKVELVELTRVEIARLIKLIRSAVKNFQLYPYGSSMRNNFIHDIHRSLELILQDTPRLEIIESEGSVIVNGRRFSARQMQELGEEDFISLMIENEIRTISFLHGISEEEVGIFLEALGSKKQVVAGKNIWKEFIQEKKITHIKVDEFSYDEVLQRAPGKAGTRKKFEDAMMMEFLMGKVSGEGVDKENFASRVAQEPQKFAQAINKLAEISGKADQIKSVTEGIKKISDQIPSEGLAATEAVENLSKVIQELDWRLKNKFIRARPQIGSLGKQNITEEIIAKLPQEEAANLVEHSLRDNADNPLAVKDLIDKMLPDKNRKQKALPGIELKLSEAGVDKETAGYITGKLKWESMSKEKRMGMFFSLPPDEFEALDINFIYAFMAELSEVPKGEEVKKLFINLLGRASSNDPQARQKIEKIIKGFIAKDAHIFNRAKVLLEILKSETNVSVYAEALGLVRWLGDELVKDLKSSEPRSFLAMPAKKDTAIFIAEAYGILGKKLKSQESTDKDAHSALRNFITETTRQRYLLERLVSLILDYYRTNPKFAAGVLGILGEAAQDALIDGILSERKTTRDSFEAYALCKRIAAVIKDMPETILKKLSDRLAEEKNRENTLSLLELATYIGKEELMGKIEPFLQNEDLELRRQAILALGGIKTVKANNILSSLVHIEKNKDILSLLRRILSAKNK